MSGTTVRKLMRTNGWTIKALAEAMNVSQVRVRQARARGPLPNAPAGSTGRAVVRDWAEFLTRKGV